jgi:hypothetical protein
VITHRILHHTFGLCDGLGTVRVLLGNDTAVVICCKWQRGISECISFGTSNTSRFVGGLDSDKTVKQLSPKQNRSTTLWKVIQRNQLFQTGIASETSESQRPRRYSTLTQFCSKGASAINERRRE